MHDDIYHDVNMASILAIELPNISMIMVATIDTSNCTRNHHTRDETKRKDTDQDLCRRLWTGHDN